MTFTPREPDYTPKGWTATECPKGHPRHEHQCMDARGQVRCRACYRQAKRARSVVVRPLEEGYTARPGILSVSLRCGHTVYYRLGGFRPDEPLFCRLHDDWYHQGSMR